MSKKTAPAALYVPKSKSAGPRKTGYIVGSLYGKPHGKQYKCHLLRDDKHTHQRKGASITVEKVKSSDGCDPVFRQWLKDKDGTLYPRTHFKSALSAFTFNAAED